MNPDWSRVRMEALLIDRATVGIDSAERAELDDLLACYPDQDEQDFELLAAELQLAFMNDARTARSSIPSDLRDRVLGSSSPKRQTPIDSGGSVDSSRSDEPPSGSLWRSPLWGWLVAAVFLFALVSSWSEPGSIGINTPLALDEWIQSVPDLVQVEWSPTDKDRPVGGYVYWSPERQQGFLTFVGLPPNDPTLQQYQLWIFDDSREGKAPVDGGVFDISSEGAPVAIDAKLLVRDASMFAVTIEKPGGVVVSSQEALPVIAKID